MLIALRDVRKMPRPSANAASSILVNLSGCGRCTRASQFTPVRARSKLYAPSTLSMAADTNSNRCFVQHMCSSITCIYLTQLTVLFTP
jgi:hypothetical protein